MSANPQLSVLMPAYNASRYIDEAIKSILEQTFTDFELLILDDCSTDNTLSIIKSIHDNRIRILSNGVNLGYLKSCNRLFSEAKGDFITFQDADDYSEPNRLSTQLKSFADDSALGMAGTWANIVDIHRNFIRPDNRATSYQEIKETLLQASQFNGATIMIRKEVLKEVGGYQEFFSDYGNEDYDWSFRIAEKFKSINVPVPLYNYRQSATGISKRISVERAISDDVVKYLASQRRKLGSDDLIKSESKQLTEFVSTLAKPYHLDQTLLYREYASAFMYSKLFKSALAVSWRAVKHEPVRWVNWRTLQYCLRKYVLSIF